MNIFQNVDAQAGLSTIQNNTVNLILTDPPYGIANNAKVTKVGKKIVSTNQAWGNDFQDAWNDVDEYWNWFKPFVAEFTRTLRDDGSVILFLDRKYTGLITHYIEKEFGLLFKNKIYFKKKNPLPGIPQRKNYRSTMEEAIWFCKTKQYTFNFGDQADMTQVYEGPIGRKATKHPTEKYSWMIKPLIKNHSKEGDIILDAFSGSGSTLVHALELNRKVIGFEKNKEFFDMAKNRIEQQQLSFHFE